MSAHDKIQKDSFSRFLLDWFESNKRVFPWREAQLPYEIAVAEAMLQKTAAINVISSYRAFLKRYPTVEALAASNLEDIQEVWRPLGLPRRARLLRDLARQVVTEYGGQFPLSEIELQRLPGIGAYGAAAIACLTLDQQAPMIDINVMRVFHRVFSVPFKPRNKPDRKLRELALSLMPAGQEKSFNLALLDLGALICRPRKPKCGVCPLRGICDYNRDHSRYDPLPNES